MSEVKFFKLTLELNDKLNRDNIRLVERVKDIVDAKTKFNLSSKGLKHIVILNLTQHTANLILKLSKHTSSKPVGIKTISGFVSSLQSIPDLKACLSTNVKGIFKVSSVKPLDTKECRTVVDALYSDGGEFFDTSDIHQLFLNLGDEESSSGTSTDSSIDMNTEADENITGSLQEALDRVNSLTGLTDFKKEIRNIVGFIELGKTLESNKVSTVFPYHYVFKGEYGIDQSVPARLMTEVLFHLGVIQNRKFYILNISEEGNEYSGINFESCVEPSETGVVLVNEIFDCEDESVDPLKVMNKLSQKMQQYKGKLVIIISYYMKDDKGISYKMLTDALNQKVNYRQIDFPNYNDTEMGELIKYKAKLKGCSITEDAIVSVKNAVLSANRSKGFSIDASVDTIVEKAFSDKAFTILELGNNNAEALRTLTPSDFKFDCILENPFTKDNNPIHELETMIGLQDVKNRVEQICNVVTARSRKKELCIPTKPICLHMQFTGAPGTGKTTVARIIGKAMRNLGFLSSGHFVEVTRNDLIGEYIGQTTPKVRKALKKAKGGIMFIDEAYSLYQGSDNDYGYEAVSELVKGMEDMKDDMVVIFAGYPKEMEKMVNMNPGLRDRIAFTIEFPDYSCEELLLIFKKMCTDSSYNVTPEAEEKIKDLIFSLYAKKTENFGNARVIRRIFERVEVIQNCRVCSNSIFEPDKITQIILEDVMKLNDDKEIAKMLKSSGCKTPIGFHQ